MKSKTSLYVTEVDKDGDLNTALAYFNTVCIANAATLGPSPANLNEIANASFAGCPGLATRNSTALHEELIVADRGRVRTVYLSG